MNNDIFEKVEKDNYYYFRDNKNKKDIKFLKKELHDCEIYSCDILRISKDFDYEFVVSNKLDSESKKYFLNHINEIGRINQKYMNPNVKYTEVSDKWFGMEDYQFLIYKNNGKIVGMVDFKIFDDDKCADDLYNCCNSICIRTVLADNEKIIEDIFKDLINKYQKRIILSHLYTDIMLKNVIANVNGIFKYLFVINRNLKD